MAVPLYNIISPLNSIERQKMTVFIFIILLIMSGFANDCGLSEVGGSVFIDDVQDIQMVKENISLDMDKNGAYVSCKFWFFNNGDTKKRGVGFPNYSTIESTELFPLTEFTSKVNGYDVKIMKKIQKIVYLDPRDNPDNLNEERAWFYWDADFTGNDTTIIENTYRTSYSYCLPGRRAWLNYIIGTGRSWAGKIEEGIVRFNFGNIITSSWVKNMTTNLPDEFTYSIDDSTLTYRFKNYKPDNIDQQLKIEFYNPYASALPLEVYDFKPYLSQLGNNKLKLMRNEIFARHGYIFSDKYLSEHFKKFHWYKENSNFKADMLPELEKQVVEDIISVENKNK